MSPMTRSVIGLFGFTSKAITPAWGTSRLLPLAFLAPDIVERIMQASCAG
jgi:hypothetical protein